MSTIRIKGSEMKVGDIITDLWFKPYRDQVTELTPYTGRIRELRGGFGARFAVSTLGMTIEPNSWYSVERAES